MKAHIMLAFSTLGFACNVPNQAATADVSVTVSALQDFSERHLLYRPTADEILRQFHCEKSPDATFHFRMSAINDKLQNPSIEYHLAKAVHTEYSFEAAEKQERGNAILRFYHSVRAGFGTFYKLYDTTTSSAHSLCAQSILRELRYLAEHASTKNILIVASDLRENSSFNSYEQKTLNPSVVAKWLATVDPQLPPLQSIEAIFVFTSRTPEEDQAFSSMAQGYKLFLEHKGAVVTIQANL